MSRSLTIVSALIFFALPAAAQPRTLGRTEDTLVISGKTLGKKILGADKTKIRVYSCRSGYMVPIPFQIDERDPSGEFCYDRGPKDRRRRDVDKGKVDANDELVVCARDAGDRAKASSMALVPGYTAVQELVLRDPLDGGLGWIYVLRFDGVVVPGMLKDDFVSLGVKEHSEEEKTYYWRGEGFAFNNDKSRRNAVRATFATICKRDENVKAQPNMLDSTQVRAVVSFMWITVVRQSNDIRVKLGGYIDGPLRMVIENRMSVYLALSLWASASDSYIILWRNKVSMPTNVECPVNLDTSDESSYTLCMDLAKRVKDQGWKFYNSHNPKPVAIDGRWSSGERNLKADYPEWNCVYGPGGAVISKFVVPDFLAKAKGSRLVYVDDEYFKRSEDEEGIEFEAGAIGYHGYRVDWTGLRKGIYSGDYVVWYASPPFKPGDESAFLNEYDHPIEVSQPAFETKDKASTQK